MTHSRLVHISSMVLCLSVYRITYAAWVCHTAYSIHIQIHEIQLTRVVPRCDTSRARTRLTGPCRAPPPPCAIGSACTATDIHTGALAALSYPVAHRRPGSPAACSSRRAISCPSAAARAAIGAPARSTAPPAPLSSARSSAIASAAARRPRPPALAGSDRNRPIAVASSRPRDPRRTRAASTAGRSPRCAAAPGSTGEISSPRRPLRRWPPTGWHRSRRAGAVLAIR